MMNNFNFLRKMGCTDTKPALPIYESRIYFSKSVTYGSIAK